MKSFLTSSHGPWTLWSEHDTVEYLGFNYKCLLMGCFRDMIKAVFSEENYVPPNHLPLSATLKIMVLSYGDHLSNNILWAIMVIGRNGYWPKWSWNEMVMGRNDLEP